MEMTVVYIHIPPVSDFVSNTLRHRMTGLGHLSAAALADGVGCQGSGVLSGAIPFSASFEAAGPLYRL